MSMDPFNMLPRLGRTRVIQLNCCHLFLLIHFFSEITNSTSTKLIPSFWSGDPLLCPTPPLHRYPCQPLPSPALWDVREIGKMSSFFNVKSNRNLVFVQKITNIKLQIKFLSQEWFIHWWLSYGDVIPLHFNGFSMRLIIPVLPLWRILES